MGQAPINARGRREPEGSFLQTDHTSTHLVYGKVEG